MLGSVHDAEDALQEALLRAWRGLGRFEGRSSLRSWLYRIATNACLDAIARRKRARRWPVDERAGGGETGVARAVPGRVAERRGAAGRALRAARERRAGVHRRAPAPAGAPARGADPARRARLLRRRGGATRSRPPSRRSTARCSAPARPSRTALPEQSQQATLRALGDARGTRAGRALHRRLGPRRRRRRRRDAGRGRRVLDAAATRAGSAAASRSARSCRPARWRCAGASSPRAPTASSRSAPTAGRRTARMIPNAIHVITLRGRR